MCIYHVADKLCVVVSERMKDEIEVPMDTLNSKCLKQCKFYSEIQNN